MYELRFGVIFMFIVTSFSRPMIAHLPVPYTRPQNVPDDASRGKLYANRLLVCTSMSNVRLRSAWWWSPPVSIPVCPSASAMVMRSKLISFGMSSTRPSFPVYVVPNGVMRTEPEASISPSRFTSDRGPTTFIQPSPCNLILSINAPQKCFRKVRRVPWA